MSGEVSDIRDSGTEESSLDVGSDAQSVARVDHSPKDNETADKKASSQSFDMKSLISRFEMTSNGTDHDTQLAAAAARPPRYPGKSEYKNNGKVAYDRTTGKHEPSEEYDLALAFELQRQFETEKAKMSKDEAMALQLQQKFQEEVDKEVALLLQTSLEFENGFNEDQDVEEALKLQAQLLQQNKEMEELEMVSSSKGKAWKFVEKVLQMHKQVQGSGSASAPQFDTVAVDDMVFLAEALLKTQQEFSEAGKPVQVDIGYHYTRRENMARIKTDGLLTKAERDANGITSHYNGSTYGDGVYTANGPFDFLGTYGDVGLIVARLKGNVTGQHTGNTANYDTVSVNRTPPIVVLRKSSQCLALIEYSASLIDRQGTNSAGGQAVSTYQTELQKIVDEFFNGGQTITSSPSVGDVASAKPATTFPVTGLPSSVPSSAPNIQAIPFRSSTRSAIRPPRRTSLLAKRFSLPARGSPTAETLRYTAPALLSQNHDWAHFCQEVQVSNSDQDCAICLTSLRGTEKVVSLKVCGHEFHSSCVQNGFQHFKSCPVCRKAIGTPQGKMPSGTMVVTQNPSTTCAGFGQGCITIQYNIPKGTQKSYHTSPGTQHGSANRTAYLPDNSEGRKLLKRLKFSFQHGLTFTIGTSLTSGMPNQVTWSSIHHKTSLSGGAHGFPDPNYFFNCNEDLDALNVPPADDL